MRMLHCLATPMVVLLAVAAHAAATPLPALNDANAIFQDGTFRLPPLSDPKDKYFLTITEDGEKARTIALPPGATGLILGRNAVPAGAWTWTVRMQRKVNPVVNVVTAADLSYGMSDLGEEGQVPVEWKGVAGASKYRIAVETKKEILEGLPPKWEPAKTSECEAADCWSAGSDIGIHRIAVKAGTDYRWTVAAVDQDDIVLAQSAPRSIRIHRSLFGAMRRAGWKLQRSDTISAPTAAKPALFSYTATQDAATPRSSAYGAQFALIWEATKEWHDMTPRVSFETKRTSSGEAKTSDVSILRTGLIGAKLFPWSTEKESQGFNWSAGLKYETARKDSTRKAMLEMSFTPVFGYLGRYTAIPTVPQGKDDDSNMRLGAPPLLQIMPLVTLSADVGKTNSAGASAEAEDTIKRLRSDARFDVLWPKAARSLGILSVSTYAQGTYWRLLGQGKHYHLSQAGLSFGLTPEISLDITYAVGADAPDFLFSRSTNVGLGIQF